MEMEVGKQPASLTAMITTTPHRKHIVVQQTDIERTRRRNPQTIRACWVLEVKPVGSLTSTRV